MRRNGALRKGQMSATARLMAFVKDRPNTWIHATEFEQFGRQSWRSRISDARKKFEAVQDGTIENRLRHLRINKGDTDTIIVRSEYRYRPQAAPVARTPHNLNQPTEGRLI